MTLLLLPSLSASQTFRAHYQSLKNHETPEWFRDAKLGIFIHWGVYSVPAWAERGEYAEWYPYRMQQKGSSTHQYHIENYGEDFLYEDFIPLFKAERWDPEAWADLFLAAGARYVVPVGEHHDGFPLWDSDLTEFNAARMGPQRDIIGELARSVRARGMKYAPSYHGLLNYYEPGHGGPHPDFFSEEYVEFMHAKLKELIDKYQPDLLWLDGDWHTTVESYRTKEVIAYFYNQAEKWGKEVAVNDRWGQVRGILGDFYTQEYEYDPIDQLIEHKWENTRGLGHSFGYNKNEPAEDFMSQTELIHMLIDNVSKNANLLINVGPKADGTIPSGQQDLLLELGRWLAANGDAIYDTRPWVLPQAESVEGRDIRFTWKKDKAYVIVLDDKAGTVTIPGLVVETGSTLRDLASNQELEWHWKGSNLVISLSEQAYPGHARAIEISPEPAFMMRSGTR